MKTPKERTALFEKISRSVCHVAGGLMISGGESKGFTVSDLVHQHPHTGGRFGHAPIDWSALWALCASRSIVLIPTSHTYMYMY